MKLKTISRKGLIRMKMFNIYHIHRFIISKNQVSLDGVDVVIREN